MDPFCYKGITVGLRKAKNNTLEEVKKNLNSYSHSSHLTVLFPVITGSPRKHLQTLFATSSPSFSNAVQIKSNKGSQYLIKSQMNDRSR